VIGIGVGGAVGGSVSGPGGISTVSSLRNRSLSRSSKRGGDSHPKLKQKGTQTELYEDSFGSDEESITSNEEIDNIQITADYAENGTQNKYINAQWENSLQNFNLILENSKKQYCRLTYLLLNAERQNEIE
jgi:hypothetical protein